MRDLAWGLASRGVAVLRYEKRTKQFPVRSVAIKNFTVRDEVIDDAVAALALLRATPGIDPKRVFILGHSLGGTLAPRIAESDPSAAGMTLLAGAALPMEDSIQPALSPEQRNQAISTAKEQAARVKGDSLKADTPGRSGEETTEANADPSG